MRLIGRKPRTGSGSWITPGLIAGALIMVFFGVSVGTLIAAVLVIAAIDGILGYTPRVIPKQDTDEVYSRDR